MNRSEDNWRTRRNTMTESELHDEAGVCLEEAAKFLEGIVPHEPLSKAYQIWMGRAQWYMLRAEYKRMARPGSYSKMYPSEASSITPEARPDHSMRRPQTLTDVAADAEAFDGRCPSCESRQPSMHPSISGGGEVITLCGNPFHGRTERAVCSSMGGHREHTWGEQDENWCPGKNASSYPLDRTRKVKDNPQA